MTMSFVYNRTSSVPRYMYIVSMQIFVNFNVGIFLHMALLYAIQ